MNKYQKFFSILLILNFNHSSYAESADFARVEKISQLTLKSFSIQGLTSEENIQLIATIQNIPETELQNKSEINNLSMMQQMNNVLFNEVGEELSQNERQDLEPIFKKMLLAQFSIFETCKIDGNILLNKQNQYKVPLTCQVPTFNQQDFKSLQQSQGSKLAAFFEFLTDKIYTSVKTPFHTFLIIDKIDNKLILHTENNQSFPGSVIQSIGKI